MNKPPINARSPLSKKRTANTDAIGDAFSYDLFVKKYDTLFSTS